jgi:fatty-acyl-CoA synthase
LHGGSAFDPADFDLFLDRQPDLSPKWRPSFVRVVETIPVLASLKVDKRALRREAWECDDPVWWRTDRMGALTRLDAEAIKHMSSLLYRSVSSST